MKNILFNNINFKIGEDAEDNWKIIKLSEMSHYWVHADGVPSSHIIIDIDQPLDSEIKYACELCKQYSKHVNNHTKFVMTQVSNLKLGSKPGEVYFKDNKNVKYF